MLREVQSLVGSADLPVRRAATVVQPGAGRVRPTSDWAGTTWADQATRARRTAEDEARTGGSDPFIDLDVLWEELDGLLGHAAASSGARRVGPLRPRPGDVASAYRSTATLGAPVRPPLVDALV